MNLSEMKFPRSLEAGLSAESLRCVLAAGMVKLWAGGTLDVPRVDLSASLEDVLRRARLRRQIRLGFEAIEEKLGQESRGIAQIRSNQAGPYGERISRLLFFSRDGAERLYRHGETLLVAHAPRLLGCLLDADGMALGRVLTGKGIMIKAVMIEHKEAVAEALLAIVAADAPPPVRGSL